MKKRNATLPIIALAICGVSFAQAASGTRDEIEQSFHVRPGGVLKIDADLGNIEITTSDSDTVRIEFIREFKVPTLQEANQLRQRVQVEMGQHDDTATGVNSVNLNVRYTGSRQDRERDKVRLDFRIAMPRKFNLDLRTVGSAKIGNVDGTVKTVLTGGSLALGNVNGPVTARTDGGSLAIGNIGGDLEATTNGGSIAAGRTNGKVMARANGGSIAIAEATDAIDVKAAGGSVAAYISKQPRSDSKLIAEAGNVELRVPQSIAITIDASCSAGRLSSDFSLLGHADNEHWKGTINGGGPLVLVRASAGNIYLRK